MIGVVKKAGIRGGFCGCVHQLVGEVELRDLVSAAVSKQPATRPGSSSNPSNGNENRADAYQFEEDKIVPFREAGVDRRLDHAGGTLKVHSDGVAVRGREVGLFRVDPAAQPIASLVEGDPRTGQGECQVECRGKARQPTAEHGDGVWGLVELAGVDNISPALDSGRLWDRCWP